MCKEAEQARAAEVSAARPEVNQERAAKPAPVKADEDKDLDLNETEQLRAQLEQARLEAAEQRETALREARAVWEAEAADARTAEMTALRVEAEQARAAAAEQGGGASGGAGRVGD